MSENRRANSYYKPFDCDRIHWKEFSIRRLHTALLLQNGEDVAGHIGIRVLDLPIRDRPLSMKDALVREQLPTFGVLEAELEEQLQSWAVLPKEKDGDVL